MNSQLAIHLVGNAHLDPAWMWQWGEGLEAFIATCRSALDLMDEWPDYVFTCSSAAHYEWVERTDPALFDRIRARVHEGRWSIVGGWWVQADCNLPSGEGFVRQALLGQRYFRERFGIVARTGYSPDAFGHNLGLPQLLRHAGMDGYVVCRPDPSELVLPSPLLRWHGPDGAFVLLYRVPYHYNLYETSIPKKVRDLAEAFERSTAITAGESLSTFGNEWSLYYGVGNHGGGPTREHLAQIESLRESAGPARVTYSDPDRFFHRTRETGAAAAAPEWRDDLQLDAPGCYSAHSEIKRLNRTSEHRLLQAEKLAALAGMLAGLPWPVESLHRGWRNVCFNHFHDILCGVAIREALDDAIAAYGEALSIAARVSREAVQSLALRLDTSGPGITIALFNAHAWELDDPVVVELWNAVEKHRWSEPVALRVTDDAGREIPSQLVQSSGRIGRDRIAVALRVSVPAFGWRCVRVHLDQPPTVVPNACSTGDHFIDNGRVRLEADPATGAIVSIRVDGRELLAGPSAVPLLIEDGTDTWGHGVERFDRVLGAFTGTEILVTERGPVRAALRVRTFWGRSWVQQEFRLHADSDVIDVTMKVFWAEHDRMLALEFVAPGAALESVAESAYCVTSKPADGTERPCGTWFGVDDAFAIVSDTWHGYSAAAVDGRTRLRASVLRSPAYALHAPHAPSPTEDLDYLDQGISRYRYELVPIRGPLDTAGLSRRGIHLAAPLIVHAESGHLPAAHPELPREYRGAQVDNASVNVTVVKRSEDDDGWVVRAHNGAREPADTQVQLTPLGGIMSLSFESLQLRTQVWRGGEWLEGGAEA